MNLYFENLGKQGIKDVVKNVIYFFTKWVAVYEREVYDVFSKMCVNKKNLGKRSI